MKKAINFLLTGVLVMFLVQGYSQSDQADVQKSAPVAQQGKFVDQNGDGICDHYSANCKSNCEGKFVDKDGDGKCDNCNCAGPCKGNQGQCGQGDQHRHGCGQNQGNCGKDAAGSHGCQYHKGNGDQGKTNTPEPNK